jgi:hypothetical protein
MIVVMFMAHGATKASKSALFVTPTHIAIQAVLHEVGEFKFGAFHRRDDEHAH